MNSARAMELKQAHALIAGEGELCNFWREKVWE